MSSQNAAGWMLHSPKSASNIFDGMMHGISQPFAIHPVISYSLIILVGLVIGFFIFYIIAMGGYDRIVRY